MRIFATLVVLGFALPAFTLLLPAAQAGGECHDFSLDGSGRCPGAFCWDIPAPSTDTRADCDVYVPKPFPIRITLPTPPDGQ